MLLGWATNENALWGTFAVLQFISVKFVLHLPSLEFWSGVNMSHSYSASKFSSCHMYDFQS